MNAPDEFEVRRVDGSSEPGGAHEYCEYLVVDLDHDPYAVAVLDAIARETMHIDPELSQEMSRLAATILKQRAKGRR